MRYTIDTSDKLAVKTKYLFHIEYKMGEMCDIQSIVKITTTKNIFILLPNKDKADIGLDNKTNIIIRWVRVRAMVFNVTLLAERTTDLPKITDKLYDIYVVSSTPRLSEIRTHNLVGQSNTSDT